MTRRSLQSFRSKRPEVQKKSEGTISFCFVTKDVAARRSSVRAKGETTHDRNSVLRDPGRDEALSIGGVGGSSSDGDGDHIGAVVVRSEHGIDDDGRLGTSLASEDSVHEKGGLGSDSGEVEGVGVGCDDSGDVRSVTGLGARGWKKESKEASAKRDEVEGGREVGYARSP